MREKVGIFPVKHHRVKYQSIKQLCPEASFEGVARHLFLFCYMKYLPNISTDGRQALHFYVA